MTNTFDKWINVHLPIYRIHPFNQSCNLPRLLSINHIHWLRRRSLKNNWIYFKWSTIYQSLTYTLNVALIFSIRQYPRARLGIDYSQQCVLDKLHPVCLRRPLLSASPLAQDIVCRSLLYRMYLMSLLWLYAGCRAACVFAMNYKTTKDIFV